MRRFVMIVDDATTDQQNAITESLRRKGWGFWHYFSDVWFIMDPNDNQTVESLREHLKPFLPDLQYRIVLRVDDKMAWAGWGHPEMYKWMNDEWTKR